MNNVSKYLILFSILVIGSIALLTFDALADTTTTDIYEIPEDYQSRNYVVQARDVSNGNFYVSVNGENKSTTGQIISDYLYDFTIYYPTDMLCSLYTMRSGYEKMYFGFQFIDSEHEHIIGFDIGTGLIFDENNICKLDLKYSVDSEIKNITVYLKKNDCIQHICKNSTEYGVFESDNALSLSSLDRAFRYDINLLSVNYPFFYYLPGSGYNTAVYSGVFNSKYVIQKFSGNSTASSYIPAIIFVNKYIETNKSGVFPEPILKKVDKASSTLRCFYEYPTQGRTPNFNYVYPKIYVKEKGKEWLEYKNVAIDNNYESQIYKLKVDNSNKIIFGSLSLSQLYIRMGYTWSQILADDFEPPKIEGIIWGVQYGYALTQNILDESSIRKSKIVFSRYVFEDNIVDTPDVGIGDLGDLPNISGSNSSIEVGSGNSSGSGSNIGSGGGHHVPAPSDSADYSDVGSFFKSLNFDFSSIGKALSGSFSLVTGFASMIGTIFQNFFGDAVGIIALLAIGICIVLRVLGR